MKDQVNSPFFSIIVPVYKVEQYLEQCVESVLCQSFVDYELILVDDGSPDNCPTMCDAYALKDERVHVIHKKNGGLSSARNAGMEQAQGNYLIFIDSDDYWDDSDALQKIATRICETSSDMVVWKSKTLNAKSGVLSKPNAFPQCVTSDAYEVIRTLMEASSLYMSAWSRVIKKSIVYENHFRFREGVTTEDIEWTISLLTVVDSISVLNSSHYVYRVGREGSITNTIGVKNISDYLSVIENCFAILDSADSAKRELLYNYMAYQFVILCAQTKKVSGTEQYPLFLKELKRISKTGIMSYRLHPKVKKVGLIFDLFGYRGLVFILGMYLIYR